MDEICITITLLSRNRRKIGKKGTDMAALWVQSAEIRGETFENRITFNSVKRGKGINCGFKKGAWYWIRDSGSKLN